MAAGFGNGVNQQGPDFPAELDRVLNITDGVLRSMITVTE